METITFFSTLIISFLILYAIGFFLLRKMQRSEFFRGFLWYISTKYASLITLPLFSYSEPFQNSVLILTILIGGMILSIWHLNKKDHKLAAKIAPILILVYLLFGTSFIMELILLGLAAFYYRGKK